MNIYISLFIMCIHFSSGYIIRIQEKYIIKLPKTTFSSILIPSPIPIWFHSSPTSTTRSTSFSLSKLTSISSPVLTVENIPEKVGENKLTSIYIIISVISFFLFGVVVKKIYYCYLKIKQHMNDRKREFEKLKKVEQQHTFDQQTNGQQHKSDHELLPILDKEIFDGYKLKKTDSHMTQIEDEIILFSINDRNLK
jgi:hypothetical protein